MDRESREAISAHDHWVFPDDFSARDDLIHRDHPPGNRAPDLQAVEHSDVLALALRWTGNDGQEARLLREDASRGATRLAVEADGAPFKAGLQRLRHLHARDAITSCLKFEHVRANHLHPLPPVATHTYRPAVIFQNFLCLITQLSQYGRVRALKSRLNAPAFSGTKEKLFVYCIGVRVLPVKMFLDFGDQRLNFPPIVNIHQELHKSWVLSLWTVNKQKAQAAAADESRNISNTRPSL